MLESIHRELLFIDWSAVATLFSVGIAFYSVRVAKKANEINHRPFLTGQLSLSKDVIDSETERHWFRYTLENAGSGVAIIENVEFIIQGNKYSGVELKEGLNHTLGQQSDIYGKAKGIIGGIQKGAAIGANKSIELIKLENESRDLFDWLIAEGVYLTITYKSTLGNEDKFEGWMGL